MLRFLKIFKGLGTTLLFVFLEVICFFLIIRYNKGQNEIFLHSSNEIVSSLVKRKAVINQSLDLKNKNDDLLKQNAQLIEELVNRNGWDIADSIKTKKFNVVPANVINRSIHTTRNYLTLDRGKTSGIKKGMGVLGLDGLVGVVNQMSNGYATAISLLNIDLRIAATIEEISYSGYISWTGKEYFLFRLSGIPKHAEISIGDEVITSGHSSIFPKGIHIGKIINYDIDQGGAFYIIEVKVDQDLSKTDLVYIIANNDFEEIKALEEQNEN